MWKSTLTPSISGWPAGQSVACVCYADFWILQPYLSHFVSQFPHVQPPQNIWLIVLSPWLVELHFGHIGTWREPHTLHRGSPLTCLSSEGLNSTFAAGPHSGQAIFKTPVLRPIFPFRGQYLSTRTKPYFIARALAIPITAKVARFSKVI